MSIERMKAMVFGKAINKYYAKYWYLFFLGILGLIVVDYAQLMIPEIMGDLVDAIKLDPNSVLTWAGLKKPVLTILFIGVAIFFGRFLWRLTLLRAGFLIEADIRKDMFLHAEKMSVRYYQEQKVGAMMALFTNDLETIQTVVSDGTIFLIDALFLGILSLIKMMISNWSLGLIATIPLLLLAACGGIIGRAMSNKYKERQEAYEQLSDFAQENFTGLSVIKAFVKEAHELREFSRINRYNKKVNVEFVRYGVLLDILIDVLVYSIIVIILALGGYYVYQDQFSAGDVTEFVGYFNTIVWPMLALAQIINLRSRGKTSLARITSLLDEKEEIYALCPVDKKTIDGNIRLEHFSFSFPGASEPTLKDLSFSIHKGETIGIVGKIGCGKSTLVQLLLHFYQIEEQRFFIDDVDLMRIPIPLLRENIGYVPQETFLFSGTIKENIAFAKEDASQSEIQNAASFADVDQNIQSFPLGYESLTGERGVSLSGGQKQRISIARAIIRDPAILILDDAVSAVDVKTEETILGNIKKEREGKTTLIVASRVSTVCHADRILVLTQGEMEAFASHDELMRVSPTYRRMVELQELEKEMEGYEWKTHTHKNG